LKGFLDAFKAIKDGMTIMAGGFGLCGIPEDLIEAVARFRGQGPDLHLQQCRRRRHRPRRLLETRQIKKMISSYVGENKLFAQQYLSGELELEFNPQGTLAERIRAGGAGIPAFYTKTGVGTLIAEGKEDRNSTARPTSWSAAVRRHCHRPCLEGRYRGQPRLPQDRAQLQSDDGDRLAMTIAEVEHLVPAGEIDPDHIHTPGIFVKRIVACPYRQAHRATHHAQARTAKSRRGENDGLDP
jgi:3-oxoacid CoA-transferase subunit A